MSANPAAAPSPPRTASGDQCTPGDIFVYQLHCYRMARYRVGQTAIDYAAQPSDALLCKLLDNAAAVAYFERRAAEMLASAGGLASVW